MKPLHADVLSHPGTETRILNRLETVIYEVYKDINQNTLPNNLKRFNYFLLATDRVCNL